MDKEELFRLSDGSSVFEGDILFHPDHDKVGWYCVANFKAQDKAVTVTSPNGAVRTVLVSELRREPQKRKLYCDTCGQRLKA